MLSVADPELAVRVAVDPAAGRRVVVRVAGRPRVRCAERRDRVLDLDVEVVDRDREARREARLEHDAVGVRVRRPPASGRCCRPAGTGTVLPGCRATPEPTRPRARPSRRILRDARLRIAGRRTAGIAGRVEQVEALRGEQLDDVGRTDRTLVAAAQADVGNRRPLEAELVGVGLDAVAVVGVAIGGVEREALGKRPGPARAGRGPPRTARSTLVAPLMPIVAPPEPASWPAVCSASTSLSSVVAAVLGAEHDLHAVGGPAAT